MDPTVTDRDRPDVFHFVCALNAACSTRILHYSSFHFFLYRLLVNRISQRMERNANTARGGTGSVDKDNLPHTGVSLCAV